MNASPDQRKRPVRHPGAGSSDVLAALAEFDVTAVHPDWFLREDNYEPALEHELESRFVVANGFLGVRGSLDIPTEASRPRTYVSGLFDVRPGPPALSALVSAPQAFAIRLAIDGESLDIRQGTVLRHSRLLDYHSGSLRSIWEHQMPSGRRFTLQSLRFVSMAVPNLAVQLWHLQLDAPAAIVVRPYESDTAGLIADAGGQVWRTGSSALILARTQALGLEPQPAGPIAWRGPEDCSSQGRSLAVLQLTSYGLAPQREQASAKARAALALGKRSGPWLLHKRHVARWQERWQASDVIVEGDEAAQRGLRFAIYHLNGAARPDDAAASIGARALTGDGYMGHVFWDTDVFMLPFYTLTWPSAARALLEYRHRTLPAARNKARRMGFRGALYAWESTDTGEEATPPYAIGPHGEVIAIRNGDLEQHISADVAYGVWQYWLATRDIDFLWTTGGEVLLETARFWVSRCRQETDGLYHIRNVIGPDEYHEAVDDNAYTNCMAAWNVARALDAASLLTAHDPSRWQALCANLDLGETEMERWRAVAGSIYVPQHAVSGIPEQFEGYFGLEDIDLDVYAGRTAPIDVLLGSARTMRSQVLKQADALMLMALLPDAFPWDVQNLAFDYYEPRCGHGSSLSPAVHSLIASRLGRVALALRYFHRTAEIDLNDTMGNSAAGLHMGALGGLWQAAVFGFGGLEIHPDALSFEPHLPDSWSRLSFPVQWRRRHLKVDVLQGPKVLKVMLDQGRPLTIFAAGRAHRLTKDRPLAVSLESC